MRTIREIEIINCFRDMAEAGAVQAGEFLSDLAKVLAEVQSEIDPGQHCTSDECPHTLSHTAGWCGYPQPRRCQCVFDYPKGS